MTPVRLLVLNKTCVTLVITCFSRLKFDKMGQSESRLGFRRAIVQLETGNRGDDEFWANFWKSDGVDCASDVWALVPSSEVRALREEYPSSLATLCYKGQSCPKLHPAAVNRLVQGLNGWMSRSKSHKRAARAARAYCARR